ncbi:MAG TPA: gliding motility-associated C-terminal domain-containing protein [Spirosoma sp.]|nr:gliding motility-associated C-terminal domain-containing protein [Spirosoma sp.]
MLVQAQNVCINPTFKGDFNLDKVEVCVGSAVNIIDVPTTLSNAGYNFQYDGKTPFNNIVLTPNKRMVYSKPGSYTILQAGSGNGTGTGTILCREVTVLPVDPVKFTVNVCSGRRATLTAKLDAGTDQYDELLVDWGDGIKELKTRQDIDQAAHTYGNDGPYTVIITGLYQAPALCDGLPSPAPPFRFQSNDRPSITKLTTTGNNSITIEYQVGNGVGVELLQKDASGIYAPTGRRGTSAGRFIVQTNARQVQCFQVVAQDACNAAGLRSDAICSLVPEAVALNKINDLTWKPYEGTLSHTTTFERYRIYRNGDELIQLFQRDIGNHRDINRIECGVQYCYTLEATISGAVQTIVTSAPVCVTGVNGDLPGSLGDVLVSVNNNRPQLVAALPTINATASYTLAISRADGPTGTFRPVGTVADKNTFIDETANPSAGPYCYQLTYIATCGLPSPPSSPVCTVFLGSKSPSRLDWTAGSPFWPGSVAGYVIEMIDSLKGTKQEIDVGSKLLYDLDPNDPALQTQTYRIAATSNTGLVSYSNFFRLQREAKILVPDAFTPNGDGLNDEFVVKGIFADPFRMTIYSRWGEIIYTTTDKTKGWDGTAGGQPAAAGHYLYRIEVQDSTGLKTVRAGTVLLIR